MNYYLIKTIYTIIIFKENGSVITMNKTKIVKCKNCENEFKTYINRPKQFCSKICYDDYRHKEIKCKSCKSCKFFKECEGVWETYIEIFGFNEFKPINI